MSHSDQSFKLLSTKDLQEMLCVGRSSIYRLAAREDFPKPVILGPADRKGSAARWRLDEIQAWIENLPREKTP